MARARMTGYTPEQAKRAAEMETCERVARLRADALNEETKAVLRALGEPVREDFPNRAAYRAAVSKHTRKVRGAQTAARSL